VELEAARLYVDPAVSSAVRARFSWALERASREVPTQFGWSAPAPAAYVLGSPTAFQEALVVRARVSGRSFTERTAGYFQSDGPQPGLYFVAFEDWTEPEVLWLVAHEWTHLVMTERLGAGADLPQWWVEGAADLTAAAVVGDHAADFAARRTAYAQARVVQAVRRGQAAGLPSLRTASAWVAASERGDPVYERAWLATAWMLGDGG
jgi:hypothetical protein